jgi:hypothetical protein
MKGRSEKRQNTSNNSRYENGPRTNRGYNILYRLFGLADCRQAITDAWVSWANRVKIDNILAGLNSFTPHSICGVGRNVNS